MNIQEPKNGYNFVPAEELSSAERIALMNGYRQRVRGPKEDKPDEEEIRYAIDLMRTERSVSAGRSVEKKAKAAPTPIALEDI